MIYLDPHVVQVALGGTNGNTPIYTQDGRIPCSCCKIKCMRVEDLDPSMAFGFYCKDSESFDSLCEALSSKPPGSLIVLSVRDERPNYEQEGMSNTNDNDDGDDDDDFVLL